MAQQLTIVVTCTDRKTGATADDLRVRHLPSGTVEERAHKWLRRIEEAPGALPLAELYRGESWAQVRKLELVAQEVSFAPRTLVASAGLGLREVSHRAPAYAATFARPNPDAVGSSVDESKQWWDALHRHAPAPSLDGPMLWVLSEGYSRVVSEDLLKRADTPRDLRVFGGSYDVPDEVRVPANGSLRRALGGTSTSLNLRMAARWLDLSRHVGPFSDEASDLWDTWVRASAHLETYNRAAISDDAAVEFIRSLQRLDPKVTKSRALRRLRDAGHACEQKRFGDLFYRTVVQS